MKTRQIKIICYIGTYSDDFEGTIIQSITNWETVDEGTVKTLQAWCAMKNRNVGYNDLKYLLLVEPEVSVPSCVAEYLAHIEQVKKDAADRAAKAATKKQMAQAKKQRLDRASELALLAELQKKYAEPS
jgi:hypothetical protein